MKTKKVIQKIAVAGAGIAFLAASLAAGAQSQAQGKSDEVDNEPIPFGINNPFKHTDSDNGSGECLQTNSTLILGHNSSGQVSYVERHIEAGALKECIPNGVVYMENIKKIGVNLISQHFPRRYCEEDCDTKENKKLPYFGLEEWKHRNHEIPVQLYINGFNNYFWAAINPQSTKYFPGDITIIDEERHPYLPNSPEGFAEWRSWLSAMFDYLDKHNATDKLLYIQLGNESDGDYRKRTGADPKNRDDYHWLAYAKLIENSYKIIRERAPNAKIVIGTIGAGGVTIDGFQRPVLEYLSGKIDEEGKIVNRERRCGGTGGFDLYDYHDFSGYKEYREWEACRPSGCILKSPGYFRDLLNSSGFPDKGLVVQQGGTYTGEDNKINKEYQTEEDQAAYLVKRGVYLLSQGVEAMQFDTYIEHFGYHGTIHNWFTLMGLAYNGTPTPGVIPSYLPRPPNTDITNFGNNCDLYDEKYRPWCEYRNNQNTCDGQLPCPDPGKDVKKLSWFSYKKLIEILKGSDWSNVETIHQDADNGVYAFKFIKDNQPVYVAWWDWWKDYPRKEGEVERCKQTYKGDYALMDKCINALDNAQMSKRITLNFANGKIRITEAIPDSTTGREADIRGYENVFHSETKDVIGGKIELTLGKRPVYIEEIPDTEAPSVSITEPLRDAKVKGVIKIKAAALDNVGINRVEFYIDSALPVIDYDSPYEIDWDTKAASDDVPHTIKAKAFDGAENSAEDSIPVTVNNNEEKVTLETSFKRKDCKLIIELTAASSLQPKAKLSYILKDNTGIVIRKGMLDFKIQQNRYSCLVGNLPIARYTVEVESDSGANAPPKNINPFENPDDLEISLFLTPKRLKTEVRLEVKTTPYYTDNCLHYSLTDANTGKVVKQGNLRYAPKKGLYLHTFLLSKGNYKVNVDTSYGGRAEKLFSL